MNVEEKKLINDLKNQVNEPLKANENYVDTFILVNIKECKQLVNLIEKQQKEIENSISKNKIRNKIKEVAEETQIYVDTEKFDIEFEKSNYTIDVLEELLGE